MADESRRTGRLHWQTTHWSRVLATKSGDPSARKESLQWLFRQYWNPIYTYLRRVCNLDPAAAEDRAQEFFVYVLEQEVLARADAERGRFRSFIKGVLRNYLSTGRRRERAQKRGGGKRVVSLDRADPSERGRFDPVSPGPSPEELLDRDWARRVFEMARAELAERLRGQGRERDLEIFEGFSDAPKERVPSYRELADRFELSEWEVWKILSTVRGELRGLMEEKVAETVSDPSDVDEEMNLLASLLS